jgi:hypothetical protein
MRVALFDSCLVSTSRDPQARNVRFPQNDGGRDGAVKRLAVSTGPLNVSPHVHVRPIDPVVFREPSSKRRET